MKMRRLRPGQSSNVDAVGYDKNERVLRVAFRNGGTYDYTGVPPSAHTELWNAPSIGRYVHEEVKPRFVQHKVEEAPPKVRDTGSPPVEGLDEAIRRFNAPPERP